MPKTEIIQEFNRELCKQQHSIHGNILDKGSMIEKFVSSCCNLVLIMYHMNKKMFIIEMEYRL